MKYRLENINNRVMFALEDEVYELRSHPYEPCLYICKDDETVKILHNAFDAKDLMKAFENGETVTAPDGKEYDRDTFCRVLAAALKDDHYEMNWTFAAKLTDSKFIYGTDVNVYLEKAVERIKEKFGYHWADLSQFHKQYRYAIEEDGQYHFIRYTIFYEDDIEREVLDVNPLNSWGLVRNGDEFIDRIAYDNEKSVYYANPKIASYEVMFKEGLLVDHWYIERYEFNKHESGDYSAFVQAGDRTTGSSRDFFIPPHFFNGTYEEFLDKYQTLVPGNQFGLFKEDLIKDEGLKKFLGY